MTGAELRDILDRRGLRLRRERGQNFLVDERSCAALVADAGVEAGDGVVEVGTGLGALTRALVDRGARVVTVEIDSGIVRALREEALLPEGVEIHHADALDLDLGALARELGTARTKLVANLPFVAATPLLRRLLDLRDVFQDWSVMLQREVAERLVAEAGTRDYGSLSVLHQLCTRVERSRKLGPAAFFPAPRVQSVFLRVEPLAGSEAPSNDELRRLENVIRPMFAQRRKTIANGLRAAGFDTRDAEGPARRALAALGLETTVRAETLSPQTLRALAQKL